MNRRVTSAGVEIAWRWFVLAFSIAVIFGLALVAGDAVRLRPTEMIAFRSRNLVLIITVMLGVARRYQVILENLVWVAAVTVALLWVVGGAAVMARLTGRRLLALAAYRAMSLAAGSAAILSCLAVIAAVSGSRQPQQTSLGLVSLFSLVVYGCWRWTSLLIGVLSYAPDLRRGWTGFVASGPALALSAATNSTLKWLSMFVVTVAAAGGFLVLPRNGSPWPLALLTLGWLLALITVSGFFASSLKEQIATEVTEWHGTVPCSSVSSVAKGS